MFDISEIISIIAGVLLAISESLPFIKTIESQGILHFLISLGTKLLANEPELEPLLQNLEDGLVNESTNIVNKNEMLDIVADINNISIKIDGINGNLSNVTDIIKNISQDFNNARQLKLQTSELYQLNYIIQYIKSNYIKRQLEFKNLSVNNKQLLVSEGYIINYDSVKDLTVINW